MRDLRPSFVILTLAYLLSSCCSSNVDLSDFDSVPLEKQIATFESAAASGCLTTKRVTLLLSIAKHGDPAARAVLPFLDENSTSPLSIFDALAVIELVNAQGVDLRGTEVDSAVRRLSIDARSLDVRQEATKTLNEIEHGIDRSRFSHRRSSG